MGRTLSTLAKGALAYWAVMELVSRVTRPLDPPRTHTVKTSDDFRLAVHEYPSSDSKGVVYLQHGLGGTPACFDLSPHTASLARWLAARGWTVFTGALRGRHPSVGPKRGPIEENRFSKYLVEDAPAIGRFITAKTGGRFHWVGHSLGGIVGLGYAAREGRDTLASLTTVASALHYGVGGSRLGELRSLEPLLRYLPSLPSRLVHRLASPLAAVGVFGADTFQYNPENMTPSARFSFHAHAVADMSASELLELKSTLEGEGILPAQIGERMPEICREISVPYFALAGSGDQQCPPATARWTFDGIKAPRKNWLLLGEEEGYSADYGHVDLISGIHAEREVFGRIEAFLSSVAADSPA